MAKRRNGRPVDSLVDDLLEGRDRLLTPGEVATIFHVTAKTVTQWANAGRLRSVRTDGGHRRFLESEVRALLNGEGGGRR